MFDVLVVGGGVIGGTILRELTKYDIKCALVEKESDVCMGQSKANSGIVHAGFDAVNGSLKAKFNVLGNRMMKDYCSDLGVKYKNNGSLVVAYSNDEIETLKDLKSRGEQNGVDKLYSPDPRLQLFPLGGHYLGIIHSADTRAYESRGEGFSELLLHEVLAKALFEHIVDEGYPRVIRVELVKEYIGDTVMRHLGHSHDESSVLAEGQLQHSVVGELGEY